MNIIYFNPDQMRADYLGCYGHPLAKTPNIDRLATQGTRYDQCHVQHTVCSPSRCSFMTGWYPHVRGHRTLWYPLQPEEPNTMKYLKTQGYETHWFGKNDLLAQESMNESVSRLHIKHGGGKASRDIFAKDDPSYWSFLYGPMDGPNSDEILIDNAIDLLRSRKASDPPFMLNLAMTFPHCPFTAPQPWYDMYDPEELPPMRKADYESKPIFYRLIREYRQVDKMPESTLKKLRAVYLGMISYVDHLLGKLMAALEETGHDKDTALIFFSDHGEWAGDYGMIEKWQAGLDDCLTRIPLIVRVPGGKEGHVIEGMNECFDIMPTTLELAGVNCGHTHFGHSLVEQLHGAGDEEGRAAFAEGGYSPHEKHCYEGTPEDIGSDTNMIYYPKGLLQQERPEASVRCTMIRTKDHKLILRPEEKSELYEYKTDPLEEHNLFDAPSHHEAQTRLEKRLLDWYVHTSDIVPHHRHHRGYSEETIKNLSS